MFRSLNHFTFFLYNITFLFFIFWFLILLFFFHRENNRPIFRKFFKSSILRAYIYIPAVSYPHLSSNKTAYKSIKCVIYPLPPQRSFPLYTSSSIIFSWSWKYTYKSSLIFVHYAFTYIYSPSSYIISLMCLYNCRLLYINTDSYTAPPLSRPLYKYM